MLFRSVVFAGLRLSGALACLAAALTTSASAAPTLRIERPRALEAVPAHPLLGQTAATVALRGRAAPSQAVMFRVPCAAGPCIGWAVADHRGRWRARVPLVTATAGRTVIHAVSRDLLGTTAARRTLRLVPPLTSPPRVPGAPRLALIGDSLAQGTGPRLPGLVPGWAVSVDARKGRPLAEGMAVLDAVRIPTSPTVLAFSLFTNDEPSAVPALDAAVRRSVARLPGRGCAIWSTIARPRVRDVTYAAANARLRALAADPALAGRLRVVDWAEVVKRHRAWLSRDRIHPTAEGYDVRAALYAAAARGCLG